MNDWEIYKSFMYDIEEVKYGFKNKKCIFIIWLFKVNNLFIIGIVGYLNFEYMVFSLVSRLVWIVI